MPDQQCLVVLLVFFVEFMFHFYIKDEVSEILFLTLAYIIKE